jgi:hypothetical protein
MKTKEKKTAKKDWAVSYNKFKNYNGQFYTGAKVGRKQKWYYDKGEWKEQKVTPDKWQFTYEVPKRRAGNAPEGSGAPVGTEYHWFILADQIVKKLDANVYSTAMSGTKYKVAHKRADKEKWNISDKAQRKHLIKLLEDHIVELRMIEDELKKTGLTSEPQKTAVKKSGKKKVRQEELALTH